MLSPAGPRSRVTWSQKLACVQALAENTRNTQLDPNLQHFCMEDENLKKSLLSRQDKLWLNSSLYENRVNINDHTESCYVLID